MNYLAHAYLSFNNPGIMVGNTISDFVKGRKKFDYPDLIQKGITLHRSIDRFTDNHPVTSQAKEIFRPVYRLYSGAFIDVVYDHFLAIDSNEFTEKSLLDFSQQVYTNLDTHYEWLPAKFSMMLPYMKEQNWLYNYRTNGGTEKSFGGLVRRAKYLNESDTAFELFETNYQLLREYYRQFWPDVKSFALQELQHLIAS
jgi:acyl carrier protein phosphodiesterase